MRTKSRTRSQGLVLAFLSVLFVLPDLARAQTTQLFPLAPLRRKRVPCDQEDPGYKIVKNKYFGHWPTSWRRFPDGWGLKSNETPDVEKSFRELPLDTGEDVGAVEPEEGMRVQPGQPRQVAPGIPQGRSPFELDKPDAGAPPAGQPRQNPVIPPMGDPFELDKPNPPRGNAPAQPAGGQNRPAAPGASIGPELSAPSERTGQSVSARRPADDEPVAQDDDGPLLALPNINLPPLDNTGGSLGAQPSQTAATNATATDDTQPTSGTAAPAPRRGFLSGLFNNLGWNWTRR
jgi:hypothetical protein